MPGRHDPRDFHTPCVELIEQQPDRRIRHRHDTETQPLLRRRLLILRPEGLECRPPRDLDIGAEGKLRRRADSVGGVFLADRLRCLLEHRPDGVKVGTVRGDPPAPRAVGVEHQRSEPRAGVGFELGREPVGRFAEPALERGPIVGEHLGEGPHFLDSCREQPKPEGQCTPLGSLDITDQFAQSRDSLGGLCGGTYFAGPPS